MDSHADWRGTGVRMPSASTRKPAQDWMTQRPVLSELHMGVQQRAEPQHGVRCLV
jgi:hypothetical protein